MGTTKKYYRVKQPYCNNKPNELWLKVRSAERIFLKCSPGDSRKRRALLKEFKKCQVNFDRKFRFFERRFKRGQAIQLERLQTGNPQQFWREINNLGPKKSMSIPMEILMKNSESSFESGQKLNKSGKQITVVYMHIVVLLYLMINS